MIPMSKKDKMNELGLIGEKIVANLLNELDLVVNHSEDKYDSEKDFTVDGYKVEVKTQVPFLTKNAFSVRPNQLTKCRSVDVLYFVSVPIEGRFDKWAGWIFRADPKNFETKKYVTKDGREMVLIPREQEFMFPIRQMTTKQINNLMQYTITEFKLG